LITFDPLWNIFMVTCGKIRYRSPLQKLLPTPMVTNNNYEMSIVRWCYQLRFTKCRMPVADTQW